MLLEPALEDPGPDPGLEEQALELELPPEGQVLEPELVGQVPALVCQSTAPAAEAQLDKVVSLCFKTLRMNIMMNSSLHKYLQLLDREDGLHPQEERRLLDQMVSLHCCHTWDEKKTLVVHTKCSLKSMEAGNRRELNKLKNKKTPLIQFVHI